MNVSSFSCTYTVSFSGWCKYSLHLLPLNVWHPAFLLESFIENAVKHQLVKLANGIDWLRVWDATRDRGQFWTGIVQSFYRLLTTPVFGDRLIPSHINFIERFSHSHVTGSTSLTSLVSDLSSDSELNTLHKMNHLSLLTLISNIIFVCCKSPIIRRKIIV